MKNFLKNIYKLAWFLSIPIFFVVVLMNSEFCIMMSCSGNTTIGFLQGLFVTSIYIILLEIVRILVTRFFFHEEIQWRKVVNIVIIPLFIITYVLGKLSGMASDIQYYIQ